MLPELFGVVYVLCNTYLLINAQEEDAKHVLKLGKISIL